MISFSTIVSKGISHCLLSVSAKRRRTKAEMKQAKEEEERKVRLMQAQIEQQAQLQ